MNRSTIYISSCMAVGALLFPLFADQADAACKPPKDMSSCVIVSKESLAQASPAMPAPPFVVTDPQTGNRLAMTYFGLREPVPGRNNCDQSNAHGCASVSSVDLMNSPVAKQSAPFLVRFQDGRSLLASPMN